MTTADAETLAALAAENQAYFERFAHIFIVCATGKSAAEMLSLLRARIGNDPAHELHVAAEEQRKITRLRLEKLLDTWRDHDAHPGHVPRAPRERGAGDAGGTRRRRLSRGRPRGRPTPTDGCARSSPRTRRWSVGSYRITFDTGGYFERIGVASFYPEVSVTFTVRDAGQHYHVPLLLNPFGFSTYRGS